MIEEWNKIPVFAKAIEIQQLVRNLVEAIEHTDIEFNKDIEAEMIKNNIDYLSKNTLIIPAKIAGALSSNIPYAIKMENAAIIRKAAREISTDLTGIEMHGYKDVEYLNFLRQEIEEFRVLFAEWVKSFNPWDYIIDRWGLFNPPGVNYDDHDPDDDLPNKK
ncbi:hypothetical protein [Gaetbulibacter sp. PBL-D1]|uniref:hypothetical protein n=1 Tax=Gaetbulibacter sp. PBL-D1 TaxID=3422594 RepID=UPI003D2F0967